MIKDVTYKIRFNKEEKQLYISEASRLGLTLAGFVRLAIEEKINKG